MTCVLFLPGNMAGGGEEAGKEPSAHMQFVKLITKEHGQGTSESRALLSHSPGGWKGTMTVSRGQFLLRSLSLPCRGAVFSLGLRSVPVCVLTLLMRTLVTLD